MNDPQQIDKALRQWSRNVDRDLSQDLPDLGHVVLFTNDQEIVQPFTWRPRLLAMAASIAILVLATLMFLPRQTVPKSGKGMEALTDMYAEVSRMFPDQSVWMSMGKADMEMGMTSLAEVESGTRLVLRVELQRRGEAGDWKEIWRRDIVTTETAWVDTVSSESPNEKLSVWTYPLSKGVLVLESYLDLPQPYAVNAREQVMFTLSDAGPTMNEILIRPGVRMIQTMVEIDSGGKGA